MHPLQTRLARISTLVALACALLFTAAPVGATQSVTNVIALTGGTALTFVAVPATATLNAPLFVSNTPANTVIFNAEIIVTDLTATSAGWQLTTTAPDFVGTALSGTAHLGTIQASGAPAILTDITVGGVLPISTCSAPLCYTPVSTLSYPRTLGTTASAFANANTGSGQGTVPLKQPFSVAIPANTKADTYTSIFVMDIASGP